MPTHAFRKGKQHRGRQTQTDRKRRGEVGKVPVEVHAREQRDEKKERTINPQTGGEEEDERSSQVKTRTFRENEDKWTLSACQPTSSFHTCSRASADLPEKNEKSGQRKTETRSGRAGTYTRTHSIHIYVNLSSCMHTYIHTPEYTDRRPCIERPARTNTQEKKKKRPARGADRRCISTAPPLLFLRVVVVTFIERLLPGEGLEVQDVQIRRGIDRI